MYALDIDILCVVFMYMYCIPENTVYNVFAQFKLFIIITFRHAQGMLGITHGFQASWHKLKHSSQFSDFNSLNF